MATVLVQQQALHHTTPPPSPIPSALTVPRRSSPIPNRHIPVCPTGPMPTSQPTSVSQPSEQPSSLLSPPDEKMRIGRPSSPRRVCYRRSQIGSCNRPSSIATFTRRIFDVSLAPWTASRQPFAVRVLFKSQAPCSSHSKMLARPHGGKAWR
ncbi:hypothetical protein HAV15_003099 [Penicillium sp. str. |nr:hypothetical protein HAV15_003099 [Penicillium sp. str. \